jgi:hypothetical protein
MRMELRAKARLGSTGSRMFWADSEDSSIAIQRHPVKPMRSAWRPKAIR